MNAGQRLAAVQLAGHRAIDVIYAPLSEDVEALVLRHATRDASGVLRLSVGARARMLRDLSLMLMGVRLDLARAVRETLAAAVAVAQVGVEPLPTTETALLAASLRAVQSVGAGQPNVLEQTGALLLRGIAAGLPAMEIAKQVRQYFSPFFAPRRDARGDLARASRQGAVRSWPGRAGMASQHARLVMLSETTAAHFRTQRRLALRDDELLRYHVSHKHRAIDECDRLERQDVGFGTGLYDPADAPALPRHGRCRCWYERAARSRFLTLSESVAA